MIYIIEHLSPSTAQSYRMCGRKVYLNKIMKIPDNTQYASTTYGSSMHKAVEFLFQGKLNGNSITADRMIHVFLSEIDSNHQKINVWGEDTVEHLKEQGILACNDFYKNFWSLEPMYIEKEFMLKRDGRLPIKCIADMVDKMGTVYDFKFGRGMWGSAMTGEFMLNMATYALAYANEFQEIPKIRLIKQKWSGTKQKSGKKKWFHKEFIVDEMQVNQNWIDYYLGVYNIVEDGIRAGIFLPTQDNNGLCKACAYRGKECDVVLLSDEGETNE